MAILPYSLLFKLCLLVQSHTVSLHLSMSRGSGGRKSMSNDRLYCLLQTTNRRSLAESHKKSGWNSRKNRYSQAREEPIQWHHLHVGFSVFFLGFSYSLWNDGRDCRRWHRRFSAKIKFSFKCSRQRKFEDDTNWVNRIAWYNFVQLKIHTVNWEYGEWRWIGECRNIRFSWISSHSSIIFLCVLEQAKLTLSLGNCFRNCTRQSSNSVQLRRFG